jgi:hypothetical protein
MSISVSEEVEELIRAAGAVSGGRRRHLPEQFVKPLAVSAGCAVDGVDVGGGGVADEGVEDLVRAPGVAATLGGYCI